MGGRVGVRGWLYLGVALALMGGRVSKKTCRMGGHPHHAPPLWETLPHRLYHEVVELTALQDPHLHITIFKNSIFFKK